MENLQSGHPAPNAPIHALVLDDSDFDRQRICRIGARTNLPIRFHEAPTLAAMAKSMDDTVFDLVLIDYRLSEGDGFHAIELVRTHARNRNAAKIMISGNSEIDVAVSALKRGCHDYLCKQDIDPETLGASIRGALESKGARLPARPPGALAVPTETPDVERALIAALRNQDVLQSLRPALVDGVRSAVRSLGRENALLRSKSLRTFMRGFVSDDDFSFQTDATFPQPGTPPGSDDTRH